MENVVDNKRKKTLIIVSILILVALIGITIAYFMSRSVSDEHTITSGNVAITYENESAFRLTGLVPLLESEILDNAAKISFTVRNTGTMEAYVKINLTDITISNLASYDFKWALYEDTTKVTTGTFASLGDNTSINLANDIKLDQNESKNYNVYVWIDESGEDQTSLMQGTFKSKVEVIGLGTKEDTLASYILGDNNSNVLTTSPTFTTTSTDRGLFVQQNDSEKSEFGFPTYYYRGSVTNNYVQFGTYKTTDGGNTIGQPILWRIVRINEDGSIRLITENLTSDYVFWNTKRTVNYINPDGTDSEIKASVENWYNSNIGNDNNLDSMVQISSFCNDINGSDYRIDHQSYSTAPNPIFTCPSGSIIANEKVGLITGDETVYSGALYHEASMSEISYLNKESWFWTMTPFYNNGYILYWFGSNPTLSDTNAEIDYASTRSVISLKSDVTISGGTGTSTDPYIIEE